MFYARLDASRYASMYVEGNFHTSALKEPTHALQPGGSGSKDLLGMKMFWSIL